MWRKIEEQFSSWLEGDSPKPLLILGAPYVGKSYSIRHFFEPDCEVDFSIDSELANFFEKSLSPSDGLKRLCTHLNVSKDCLFFFKNIESAPAFMAQLPHFPKNTRIICTGKFLSIALKRQFSDFPIACVDCLTMYPMDFEEFLIACGHELLKDEIFSCFQNGQPLYSGAHQQALRLYHDYLQVGGLPESVQNYIHASNQKIENFSTRILQEIEARYLSDAHFWTTSHAESEKICRIYQSLPSQLTQTKSQKFRYDLVEKKSNARKYASALDWLLTTGLFHPCHRDASDQTRFYLLDTALLALHLTDELVLAHNYIAQQLISNFQSLSYWHSGNTAHLPFILPDNTPLEIQLSFSRRKSLTIYQSLYHPRQSLQLSPQNFGSDETTNYIPLYAAWCIGR
ncbi:MAG: AAA family ATPase [Streptococcaceae bacterium]|nr:AAA family ATPase [Streptococcaceae bacterium]